MDTFAKLMRVYEKMRAESGEPQEQPPISVFAIKLAFEGLDLPVNPVLERLYQWHNGICHLNAFFSFLPLGSAVKTYRAYAETRENGWMDIKASWFPVFDQNGDYQYCVDLKGSELWRVDLEDGSLALLARNYESFLDAVVSAFDRELASFNTEFGFWEIENDAWGSLCEEYGLEKGA